MRSTTSSVAKMWFAMPCAGSACHAPRTPWRMKIALTSSDEITASVYRGLRLLLRRELWLFSRDFRRSLICDPARRRQRKSRPRDQFVGVIEQALGCLPEGKVDGVPLLLVVERRKCFGLLECRLIVFVDPKVER